MTDLKRLIPYLIRYRWGLLLGGLFVIGSNLLNTFMPWMLGRIVDSIDGLRGVSGAMAVIGPLIWFYLLVVVLEGIQLFYKRRVMIGISRWIENDLRNDFYQRVQKLSARNLDSIRTGEIMSRATNDISNVRMVLGPGIMYSFTTLTMLIFVLSVMFSINVELTLYSLIPMPILSVIILFASRALHSRFSQVQENLSELTTIVQENISGIRVVKSHCREDYELGQFQIKSGDLRDSNLAASRIYAGFGPLMMTIAGVSTVIILFVGGNLTAAGRISLGDLVTFFTYLGILIWPMMSLGWVINIFQRGAASMKLINKLVDTKPYVRQPEKPETPEQKDGGIVFENVRFKYNDDDNEVLTGISFRVAPGSTTAIVGATGSGKSTILRLIPRLYDVTAGSVLVDGLDIRQWDLRELRRRIGYVPQETFLFSESLRDNIAFGAHGRMVSQKEIERVAEISRLSNDIEDFPKGYETMLGERGINMSGGQKQRAAIARALAGDPEILLLDDCLSAVDTNTEREILRGLRQEMSKRTSIIVSHRISSIMDADQIIVIRDGGIIQQGSHDELLSEKGLYANLWQKQQLSEELEISASTRPGMQAETGKES